MNAPIALFVYNRPEHTLQTVTALQNNVLAKESDLIIFSDGPKNEKDTEKLIEVRKYLKTITGFKSITIKESKANQGLANSIITGVTETVSKFGQVIVLEDDLVTSKYFLKYMNEALELYKEAQDVISIHGYIYPVKTKLPDTFFLKGADCWGWATWKRGWDLFEADGQKLLAELEQKNLTKEFDFAGSYPYTQMLKDQIAGQNNSWAIRWYASAFIADKLTLYPGRSLVKNIGFDNSGTHCGRSQEYSLRLSEIPIKVESIPIKENKRARKCFEIYFKGDIGLPQRIEQKLASFIRRSAHAQK